MPLGSVTKRLLSSTASKAYGSASCHGMDCELSISASALGGQCYLSSLRCLALLGTLDGDAQQPFWVVYL